MQVRKPDAPISANVPMPLKNAPEHSPIADSSRLTETCRKRASLAYCVMRLVIQPSGRLATSEMPQSADVSAMRLATVSAEEELIRQLARFASALRPGSGSRSRLRAEP